MEHGSGVVGRGNQGAVVEDGETAEGDYSGTLVRYAGEDGRGDGGGESLRDSSAGGFSGGVGFGVQGAEVRDVRGVRGVVV